MSHPEPSAPTPDVPGRRLLIVDDEPVILQLLTTVFDDQPWEVEACGTGTEALAAMDRGIDVLLTDKNLPDVGGLELVRRARERTPDVEAIILTGYASLDTAITALQLDVFDYLVKPPSDIFVLQRKVRQAFEKQAMARQNQRLLADLRHKNDELEDAIHELRSVQSELIQSEKLAGIGTLAAGIAHEVSSPLFGVMGLAEAILDEDDLDLVRTYATEIVSYSQNIKEIVQQLSSYSRSASREYLTTVDLPQVIADAALLVARSTGIDTERITVDAASGLCVQARTNEVQQVLVNLLKNGVEAIGDGPGGVHVHAWRDEGAVQLDVRDEGEGIPADRLSMIFDPFYTTKPPGKGTGLGLNIVYRIVTRYQGTVSVESELGQGTTFHLRLPVD